MRIFSLALLAANANAFVLHTRRLGFQALGSDALKEKDAAVAAEPVVNEDLPPAPKIDVLAAPAPKAGARGYGLEEFDYDVDYSVWPPPATPAQAAAFGLSAAEAPKAEGETDCKVPAQTADEAIAKLKAAADAKETAKAPPAPAAPKPADANGAAEKKSVPKAEKAPISPPKAETEPEAAAKPKKPAASKAVPVAQEASEALKDLASEIDYEEVGKAAAATASATFSALGSLAKFGAKAVGDAIEAKEKSKGSDAAAARVAEQERARATAAAEAVAAREKAAAENATREQKKLMEIAKRREMAEEYKRAALRDAAIKAAAARDRQVYTPLRSTPVAKPFKPALKSVKPRASRAPTPKVTAKKAFSLPFAFPKPSGVYAPAKSATLTRARKDARDTEIRAKLQSRADALKQEQARWEAEQGAKPAAKRAAAPRPAPAAPKFSFGKKAPAPAPQKSEADRAAEVRATLAKKQAALAAEQAAWEASRGAAPAGKAAKAKPAAGIYQAPAAAKTPSKPAAPKFSFGKPKPAPAMQKKPAAAKPSLNPFAKKKAPPPKPVPKSPFDSLFKKK